MAYKSVIENLRERAEAVKASVEELGRHSGITDMDEEDRRRRRDPFFDEDDEPSAVVIWSNPYFWQKLSPAGQQVQHRLHEAYGQLRDIVQSLLRGRVPQVQKQFEQADKAAFQFVTQKAPSGGSVEGVVQHVTKAVDALVSLVADVPDASDHRVVFVPDTNAFLHNPKIETWAFPDASKFRLVLTPTVLSELDRLKVIGRDTVKDKAERIIRQIKEYQRRGSLHRGVTIRKDVSELVALAVEPEMSDSLPWLKADNDDDGLIASMVEVMRAYPHSPVILVTRDINAQNKASFAGFPFDEPPDPPALPVAPPKGAGPNLS